VQEPGDDRGVDITRRGIFTAECLHQPPLVETAMGRQTQAVVAQLDAACRAADDVAKATADAFEQHPDAQILTSFPGIGPVTGARVLGEIGDDRARFRAARGLKSYACSAPIVIAPGKSLVVHHRKVKNLRLAAASYAWIFGALPTPQVKYHYDLRRAAGTSTPQRCATCSTASRAASITACRPVRPSTPARPSSPRPRNSSSQPRLDS
jgi:transposase